MSAVSSYTFCAVCHEEGQKYMLDNRCRSRQRISVLQASFIQTGFLVSFLLFCIFLVVFYCQLLFGGVQQHGTHFRHDSIKHAHCSAVFCTRATCLSLYERQKAGNFARRVISERIPRADYYSPVCFFSFKREEIARSFEPEGFCFRNV